MVVTENKENGTITVQLMDDVHIKAVILCDPFRLDIFDDDEPVFSVNSRHLLNIEHLREKPVLKS